jgi:urea transport system permease protein
MKRILIPLLVLLLALAPVQGRAQTAAPPTADEAMALLASGVFDQVRQGVQELADTGSPRAATIITALQNGALYYNPDDQSLYIKQDDGTYLIAATGAPAPAEVTDDTVKTVRVNNGIRGAMDAALGSLQLMAPDAATRMTAAEAVFHSHQPDALPALAKALAQEKDPDVKLVMQQAQAAALLSSTDASEADRLAAVKVIAARGDQDSRSLLDGLSGQPPAVAAAAAAAIASIDRSLQLWSLLESVYYGLSLGSVLLLAAAGLAITFGVMGVINMAHGEMVMIGAYTTFVVQQVIRAYAPGLFGASLIIAVPLAFLVSGVVGIIVERTLIRWLYGRPLETLLATWGLSLVLQQVVRTIFGADNQNVGTPDWMGGLTKVGGLTLTWNRNYIIIFAIIVLFALMASLRYTSLVLRHRAHPQTQRGVASLGLRMRAVTQNRRMAAAMGIRTPWIDAMTFGLGSGVAGMAGVALSQIDNVSPNLGQNYIIDSFMVVVFGGVGNLWGTAVSALTLGIVNKFLEPVAGAVLAKIVVLVLLILFIQRKPRGLFPLKGRAVES